MDITDLSHTYQQQTIFIQPEMIPPNFIERFPSELKINEKIPLHIHGRVYGQPKPSVQWLKNGKPMYSDERIHYHVLVSINCFYFLFHGIQCYSVLRLINSLLITSSMLINFKSSPLALFTLYLVISTY